MTLRTLGRFENWLIDLFYFDHEPARASMIGMEVETYTLRENCDHEETGTNRQCGESRW